MTIIRRIMRHLLWRPYKALALSPAIFVASCAPGCIGTAQHGSDHLPPSAYVSDGCVVLDDVVPGTTEFEHGVWSWNGVMFGFSITEDSCIVEWAP